MFSDFWRFFMINSASYLFSLSSQDCWIGWFLQNKQKKLTLSFLCFSFFCSFFVSKFVCKHLSLLLCSNSNLSYRCHHGYLDNEHIILELSTSFLRQSRLSVSLASFSLPPSFSLSTLPYIVSWMNCYSKYMPSQNEGNYVLTPT